MFSQVGEHISLGIRVSQVGEQISLGICVSPGGGTHITRDTCFPGGGTHIARDMCFPGRGTRITRDTCFLEGGTQITRDMCFRGGGTHIARDTCFPRWGNTYHWRYVCFGRLEKTFPMYFYKRALLQRQFLDLLEVHPFISPLPPPKLARLEDPTATPTRTAKKAIDCLPFWCPKAMKGRPCWCPRPILWVLNSFLMQTLPFVAINLHRCWPRE